MKENVSRRRFLQGSALAAAGASTPCSSPALAPSQETGKPCPIQLGIATYTFRAFPREKMIGFLKQFGIDQINAKDVKDHLPSDSQQEEAAIKDYARPVSNCTRQERSIFAKMKTRISEPSLSTASAPASA